MHNISENEQSYTGKFLRLNCISFMLLLFLAVWPAWQIAKFPATQHSKVISLDRQIQADEQLLLQYGLDAQATYGSGRRTSVSLHLARLQKDRTDALEDPFTGVWQAPAWLKAGFFFLAVSILVVFVGLFLLRMLGHRAQRNPIELIDRFHSARYLMQVLQGIHVMCLILSLCSIGVSTLMVLIITAESFSEGIADAILSGLGVLFVGFKAHEWLFMSPACAVSGETISFGQSPTLWRMVQKIAIQLGVEAPVNIVIGVEGGIQASLGRVELTGRGSLPSGMTLYLPLPMLAYLDRDGLRAMIACEMAHLRRDEQRTATQIASVYNRFIRNGSKDSVEREAVSIWEDFMIGVFQKALRAACRTHEQRAVHLASQIAGKEALAVALLRCQMLDEVVRSASASIHRDGDVVHVGILQRVQELVVRQGLRRDTTGKRPDEHVFCDRLAACSPITPEIIARATIPDCGTLLEDLALAPKKTVGAIAPRTEEALAPTVSSTVSPAGESLVSVIEALQWQYSVGVRAEFIEAKSREEENRRDWGGCVTVFEKDLRYKNVFICLGIIFIIAAGKLAILKGVPLWSVSLSGAASFLCFGASRWISRRPARKVLKVGETGIELVNGFLLLWRSIERYRCLSCPHGAILTIDIRDVAKLPPSVWHGRLLYRKLSDKLIEIHIRKLEGIDYLQLTHILDNFHHAHQVQNEAVRNELQPA